MICPYCLKGEVELEQNYQRSDTPFETISEGYCKRCGAEIEEVISVSVVKEGMREEDIEEVEGAKKELIATEAMG